MSSKVLIKTLNIFDPFQAYLNGNIIIFLFLQVRRGLETILSRFEST